MKNMKLLSATALAVAIVVSGAALAQPWWWGGEDDNWSMHRWGPGTMQGFGPGAGAGMMGAGMMGAGMMPMMFVMMDTDGDEAVSFEEMQAVHKRMFDLVDADKDGKITIEEVHAFWGIRQDAG